MIAGNRNTKRQQTKRNSERKSWFAPDKYDAIDAGLGFGSQIVRFFKFLARSIFN